MGYGRVRETWRGLPLFMTLINKSTERIFISTGNAGCELVDIILEPGAILESKFSEKQESMISNLVKDSLVIAI